MYKRQNYSSRVQRYLDNLEALALERDLNGNPWTQAEVNQILEKLAQRLSRDIDKLPCGSRLD